MTHFELKATKLCSNSSW